MFSVKNYDCCNSCKDKEAIIDPLVTALSHVDQIAYIQWVKSHLVQGSGRGWK